MTSPFFLQQVWYILIGTLFTVYSILDGIDLGSGVLFSRLPKTSDEKRVILNLIGPMWDGNEVWLLAGAGALFAAFPQAYASVFSGFYLALMLVLLGLIFRAVSLEFWNHDEKHQRFWGYMFVSGSFLPPLLLGVVLGNVMVGIQLNSHGDHLGGFFTLFRPFPLMVGFLGLSAMILQGSTFLTLKTSGDLQNRARRMSGRFLVVFFILFVISGLLVSAAIPGAFQKIEAWIAAGIVLISWISAWFSSANQRDAMAFFMSSLQLAGLWGIAGAVHYPCLVKAANDEKLSLTIVNSASGRLTLGVMLIIAIIGMPLVAAYSLYVFKVFKGKSRMPSEIQKEEQRP